MKNAEFCYSNRIRSLRDAFAHAKSPFKTALFVTLLWRKIFHCM